MARVQVHVLLNLDLAVARNVEPPFSLYTPLSCSGQIVVVCLFVFSFPQNSRGPSLILVDSHVVGCFRLSGIRD